MLDRRAVAAGATGDGPCVEVSEAREPARIGIVLVGLARGDLGEGVECDAGEAQVTQRAG
jgi:hypothetical protein